jgi:hypothetical protein
MDGTFILAGRQAGHADVDVVGEAGFIHGQTWLPD